MNKEKLKIFEGSGYYEDSRGDYVITLDAALEIIKEQVKLQSLNNNSVIDGIISESDNISKCDNCNGIIDSFTGLCNEGCKRTAYSEKDLRECWNKALEVMVKSEPQDFDTWLSEYER